MWETAWGNSSTLLSSLSRVNLVSEVIKEVRSDSTMTHAELRRSLLSWEAADRPIATWWPPARLLPASKLYPVGLAIATPSRSVLASPGSPASLGVSATSLVPLSAGLSGLPRAERKLRGPATEGKSALVAVTGEGPPAVARSR